MSSLSEKISSEGLTFDDVLFSACPKTTKFRVFDKKTSKTRLLKFLKPRSLLIVNDCFKNENNAVFGVFLQRLFIPACSEIVLSDEDLPFRFMKNISLNLLIVTIVTDTVTKSNMGMTIAIKEGIEVIHKSMSFEERSRQVRQGKQDENRMQFNPVVSKANLPKYITKAKNNPDASKDLNGQQETNVAIGTSPESPDRAETLIRSRVNAQPIDTTFGYLKNVLQVLKEVKKTHSDIEIVVGNVSTTIAALTTEQAATDTFKIGIGTGSNCIPQITASVDVPQLSVIFETAITMKGKNVPVIANRGIRCSGYFVKIFMIEADCMITGSPLFTNFKKSHGETTIYNRINYKSFRGIICIEAMQQKARDRNFQKDMPDNNKRTVAGITDLFPYNGTLCEFEYQLPVGLYAVISYYGTKNLKELWNANFVRATNTCIVESHSHDLDIINEVPNYSR